jgi:predicted alpha/beta hydrolase
MVVQEGFERTCEDGVRIRGDAWRMAGSSPNATVLINPATGVLARYYHRYARFLAGAGLRVLTFDYRGIGRSRPPDLRGCGFRWRDWGERDFDAMLCFALEDTLPVHVVGHSIGGFLPGFSRHAQHISRMLTVGAQYAYWRDYSADHRARLFWKWHVAMPALALAFGYFPGRRLGWLEDLPKGVADEWSFRRARMELSYPSDERSRILARFQAVRATICAIGVSDDDIASPRAVERALGYYGGAERRHLQITPRQLGCDRIGHFGLFHERFRETFWEWSLDWLLDRSSAKSPIVNIERP